MFNRKKEAPPKKRSRDLSQYGIFDYSDDFDPTMGGMDDDGDSDLEAELAAITAGGGQPRPKPKPKMVVAPSELDKMVAESMKDIGSDEELSGDDDDPDLLGELQEITGEEAPADEEAPPEEEADEPEQVFLPTTTVNVIDIIKTRVQMYEAAEANAKEAGESSRARRFNRGLKTLKDMLKQASAGKNINVDDIPPEVSVKGAKPAADAGTEEPPPAPTRPAPSPPKSPPVASPPTSPPAVSPPTSPPPSSPPPQSPIEEKPQNPKVAMLNARKQEYKSAALTAKRSGDTQTALQFIKVIKQFDVVIKMAEEGQEVDLSDMPPPPDQFLEFMAQMQAAASQQPEPAPAPEQPPPAPEAAESGEGLVTAGTLLEALQQRLEKYQSVEAAAKEEGNSGKARRFGRIVKQYQDAIKLHKAGKPVPLDELPTPPGFGPLPTEGAAPRPAPPPPPRKPPTPSGEEEEKPSSATSSPDKPAPPPRAKLQKQNSTSTRISGNQITTSHAERQMQILLQRQKEFKIAAIEAKKAGEIEQAKEYLKIYKGFESVLNAASGGLPVDMSTLPIPPSQRENLEDSFAVVTTEECDPNDDISDLSVRLEEQLAKQLMMCKNTRDHHKAMGDVAGTNRFENLALAVQKDLDFVRFLRRKNMPVPKFHYEKKSFNIVHCNTDLTENEVEVNVVRGISYNVPNPKDVDTYVKIEFPYPQDYPYKNKTPLVRNTDSPDYDQKYIVEIQRSNRQCQRIFKRQAVKFEIYSRGGFLRSDVLIGTVNVKLQPLETKCDMHDSYELMDGRKKVGGKLEVKMRIRNPILTKQIEHIDEKWLIIDH